jgi:hypothetical protein
MSDNEATSQGGKHQDNCQNRQGNAKQWQWNYSWHGLGLGWGFGTPVVSNAPRPRLKSLLWLESTMEAVKEN